MKILLTLLITAGVLAAAATANLPVGAAYRKPDGTIVWRQS